MSVGGVTTGNVQTVLLICVCVSVHITLCCDRRAAEELYTGTQNDEIQEVCFDSLGCFNNSLPCHRSGFPPSHPDAINTQFFLFTRANSYSPDRLEEGVADTFHRFNPGKETKVVLHGYTDSYNTGHIRSIKDALLLADDVNVIMVNWSDGATKTYPTSRMNTRVVGRKTANLLMYLRNEFPTLMNIHIIGHSLGAHAAGYAGEELGFVDRITGLDPAGPLFTHEFSGCRLDSTDGAFVDIIHTNGHSLGFGLMEQLGHQDFYPNGGELMPGCGPMAIICNHLRSIEYFVESIKNRGRCSFDAYRCSSWDDFTSDLCTSNCSIDEACSKMGYHVMRERPMGKYFLQTARYKPYC